MDFPARTAPYQAFYLCAGPLGGLPATPPKKGDACKKIPLKRS